MADSVLVLGAGLVGSSLGLALTRAGYDVMLWDIASSHALVAASLGAGRVSDEETDDPDIVVVATPPDVIPGLVAEVLGKPYKIRHLSIQQSGQMPPLPIMRASHAMAAEAAPPVPLEAGESLVTTTVSGQVEVAD